MNEQKGIRNRTRSKIPGVRSNPFSGLCCPVELLIALTASQIKPAPTKSKQIAKKAVIVLATK
jgi:hypothetical protein